MGPALLEANQTQHIDQISDAATYGITGKAGQAKGKILGDAEMGKESVALYHVADPPLSGRHVYPSLRVEEQPVIKADGAGQRPKEAGQTLEGQTLTRAGGSNNRHDLALGMECHL